jgi:hypothetical protein
LFALLAADTPSEPVAVPKVSTFAPAADLLAQVDFFLARASESLSDPARFDLAKQSRTAKDANTLAALALMLAMHDEKFAEKPAMASLLRASGKLAAASDNYEQASAALVALKRARSGSGEPGAAAKWEKVASLPALMKQVPLVHSGLKRAVDGDRLARLKAQSSGQSAALAAIAQASMLDAQYAKTPAEATKWRERCAEMRDAAGSVNAAIHAQDAARVAAGMKRLFQSCESCHAAFRSQ